MKSHVKGTGDHAYPPQDPAELRARSVRNAFERIRSAKHGVHLVWDSYTRAAIHGGGCYDAYQHVRDAEERMDRILREAEGAVLQALEDAEVPVIHEVRGGAINKENNNADARRKASAGVAGGSRESSSQRRGGDRQAAPDLQRGRNADDQGRQVEGGEHPEARSDDAQGDAVLSGPPGEREGVLHGAATPPTVTTESPGGAISAPTEQSHV